MANLSSDSIFQILYDYIGPLIPDAEFNLITVIADQSYTTIPTGGWLRDMVLHEAILSPQRYRRDIFDCDDYVMFAKTKISLYAANNKQFTRPIAVGFLLTEAHAFNFGIDNNNALYLLNTQSENVDFLIPISADECANFLGLSNSNHLKLIYI